MMGLSRNRRGHSKISRTSAGKALSRSRRTVHPLFEAVADAARSKVLAEQAAVALPAPPKWLTQCAAQMSAPRGLPDPGDVGTPSESGLVGRYLGRTDPDGDPAQLRDEYVELVARDVPPEAADGARRLTRALLDLNTGLLCRDDALRDLMVREQQPAANELAGQLMTFQQEGVGLTPPDRLVRAVAYPVDAYTVVAGGTERVGSSWPTAAAILALRACRMVEDAVEKRTSPVRAFDLLAPASWPAEDQVRAAKALQHLLGVPTPFDCTGSADHLTCQLVMAVAGSAPHTAVPPDTPGGSRSTTADMVARLRGTADGLLARPPRELATDCVAVAVGQEPLKRGSRATRIQEHARQAASRAATRAFTRETAPQDLVATAFLVEEALAGAADAGAAVELAGRLAPDDAVLRGWFAHHLETLVQGGETLTQVRELMRREREKRDRA